MLTRKLNLLKCPGNHFRRLSALKVAMGETISDEASLPDTKSQVHQRKPFLTHKLPHFIDQKCIKTPDQAPKGTMPEMQKNFNYNYHQYSIYDLGEAALRAKEESAKYYKDRVKMEKLMLEKMKI